MARPPAATTHAACPPRSVAPEQQHLFFLVVASSAVLGRCLRRTSPKMQAVGSRSSVMSSAELIAPTRLVRAVPCCSARRAQAAAVAREGAEEVQERQRRRQQGCVRCVCAALTGGRVCTRSGFCAGAQFASAAGAGARRGACLPRPPPARPQRRRPAARRRPRAARARPRPAWRPGWVAQASACGQHRAARPRCCAAARAAPIPTRPHAPKCLRSLPARCHVGMRMVQQLVLACRCARAAACDRSAPAIARSPSSSLGLRVDRASPPTPIPPPIAARFGPRAHVWLCRDLRARWCREDWYLQK